MKRAIFTFLAIVTFLSCAAQNPKAKVFNHGIKVLGSSTVTTVGASSRLVVVDADKNHVEISFDDLKTQLALAGGGAYTAGDGLELNVTEFKVDSTRIPRLHANSPVKTLEFSVGTIAANDAASLPPEVIRYDTDGAAATDGFVDGLAFVKVGDVYTLTATRNGLSDLTANFTDATGGSVSDNSITNAKLADMAPATFKGRNTGTGDPQDLTVAQAQALLEFSSGTFTPTLTDGSDVAYTATKGGSYYKIGKMCYVRVTFTTIDFPGSPTGRLKIGNLPFTVGSNLGSINITTALGGILPTDATKSYYAIADGGTTELKIYELSSGGIGNIPLDALDPAGSGTLTLEGVFITN